MNEMMSEVTCLLPLSARREIYLIVAALVFVYGCYVVWHWDFRVVRPLMALAGRYGVWYALTGRDWPLKPK